MNYTETRTEMSKCLPGFVNAVNAVIGKKVLDRNGIPRGTQRVSGYVQKIHDDETDELYGTIDVQEFQQDYPSGFHEGVLISAISQSKTGMTAVPCLYSEVIIVQDPMTKKEYVTMFSHVDLIQQKSHKEVMVGVVETEEFQEGDDGDDVHELKETGVSAVTNYTKDNIIDTVKTKDGDCTVTQTFDSIVGKVHSDNGDCTITQTSDGYKIEAKDSVITIKSDGAIDVKGNNITVNADDITINGGSNNGLIKIAELTSKINGFISEFNSHTHKVPGVMGGSASTISATPDVPASNLNKSDYEDTKVKH